MGERPKPLDDCALCGRRRAVHTNDQMVVEALGLSDPAAGEATGSITRPSTTCRHKMTREGPRDATITDRDAKRAVLAKSCPPTTRPYVRRAGDFGHMHARLASPARLSRRGRVPPSSEARHACAIVASDRLLLAAELGRGIRVVHPPASIETMARGPHDDGPAGSDVMTAQPLFARGRHQSGIRARSSGSGR
jgi:hypothetical protein